jgi:hypothetical protein
VPIDFSDNSIKAAGLAFVTADVIEHFQFPSLLFLKIRLMKQRQLTEIKEYFKKQDVLAFTNQKRNIFAQLFNPSLIKKMVFRSDTPLLVLRG